MKIYLYSARIWHPTVQVAVFEQSAINVLSYIARLLGYNSRHLQFVINFKAAKIR